MNKRSIAAVVDLASEFEKMVGGSGEPASDSDASYKTPPTAKPGDPAYQRSTPAGKDDDSQPKQNVNTRNPALFAALKGMLGTIISPEDFNEWYSINSEELDRGEKYNLNGNGDIICNVSLSEIIIISKSNKAPDYLRAPSKYEVIAKEYYNLVYTDEVPKLYFFYIVREKGYNVDDYPKELAHDFFIAEALTELFSLDQHNDLPEISKFIKENSAKINKLRSMMSTTPKLLGGGADGVAYAFGKDLVLKIFQDSHAYGAAVKAMERLHKTPELAKTEAMIYDVGILGTFSHEGASTTLYYYIMERMTPVYGTPESNGKIAGKKAIESIGKYVSMHIPEELRALKPFIEDKSKLAEIKAELTSATNNLVLEIENEYRLYKDMQQVEKSYGVKEGWLDSFVEEILVKYLTSRTDLHMGNLGVTNQGDLRYFDPAFKEWTSEINIR